MTQQRLKQLRGELAEMRDTDGDCEELATLVDWAVWLCDDYAALCEDAIVSRAVCRRIEKLADAMGILEASE